VDPGDQLKGGHLLKKEFGGPDNDENVVPWSLVTEREFTQFEEQYQKAIDADVAKAASATTPFTATVRTQATFEDRPDLEATDADLDNAGWVSGQPRADRKKKFAEIAENFSHIPTKVSVEVLGVTGPSLLFDRSGVGVAPKYLRNDAALKRTFNPTPYVYDPSPNLPRTWVRVEATWKNQSDLVRKQLKHEWAHKTDWGFGPTDGETVANLKLYETRLKDHVESPGTTQIRGVYRGTTPVMHYLDQATSKWVCTHLDGRLYCAWRLGAGQVNSLLLNGSVK
jgi:hypothetical protein